MPENNPQKPLVRTSATPAERRKFWLLVGLGGVVIVLFWVALLPFSLRQTTPETAGPRSFFQRIGEELSLTGIIFNKTREVESATSSQK